VTSFHSLPGCPSTTDNTGLYLPNYEGSLLCILVALLIASLCLVTPVTATTSGIVCDTGFLFLFCWLCRFDWRLVVVTLPFCSSLLTEVCQARMIDLLFLCDSQSLKQIAWSINQSTYIKINCSPCDNICCPVFSSQFKVYKQNIQL